MAELILSISYLAYADAFNDAALALNRNGWDRFGFGVTQVLHTDCPHEDLSLIGLRQRRLSRTMAELYNGIGLSGGDYSPRRLRGCEIVRRITSII